MTKIRLLKLVKFIVNSPTNWKNEFKSDEKSSECPKDYGIKSHIQDFYCPPDESILKSGEFIEGDEFQFLVEPKKKKSKWIRFSFWMGVNLLLVGLFLSLTGYLMPQRVIIVGKFREYIVLDKWAAIYNGKLIICQLIGLLCLACGALVTCCSLLLFHCERTQKREYYIMRATIKPQRFVEPPIVFKDSQEYWGMHCIPSSGTVKGVQPNFLKNF